MNHLKDALLYTYYVILSLAAIAIASVLVALTIPMEADAQVVDWDEVANADGYKLYYEIVTNCDDIVINEFRYSYKVGQDLSYDISKDANFSSGQHYYMFRVSAYNENAESDQSDTFACLKSNRPDKVKDVKKKFK